MNQVAEENVQSITYSLKNVNSLRKTKSKEPSDCPSDVNKVNEEELSESLSSALHLGAVNGSLSNGTAAGHSPPAAARSPHESTSSAAPGSHCDNGTYANDSEDTCSNQMLIVRNMVEAALGNLESTLCLEDKPQDDVEIISYESELQMPEIMRLIQKDLSEPYSIYTYRYFIHNWPKLCFLAMHEGKCIGAIVCKLDMHRNVVKRGYIAMLAVDEKHRKKRIGSRLVQKAIQAMTNDNADEVVLETEITNKPALKLYENLGFVRDKRLFRYYLNGVDALRLKLWLR